MQIGRTTRGIDVFRTFPDQTERTAFMPRPVETRKFPDINDDQSMLLNSHSLKKRR